MHNGFVNLFDTYVGIFVELAIGAPKATEEIQPWCSSISALIGFIFMNSLNRFHFLL